MRGLPGAGGECLAEPAEEVGEGLSARKDKAKEEVATDGPTELTQSAARPNPRRDGARSRPVEEGGGGSAQKGRSWCEKSLMIPIGSVPLTHQAFLLFPSIGGEGYIACGVKTGA